MNLDGLLGKALGASRMGSFSAALAAVEEALAAEPTSRRAHRVLAVVLLRKGDPWEAETALLAGGPVLDAEGIQLHAQILFRIGRHREAIERAREAVRLAPESAEAHHDLGRLLHTAASQQDGRSRSRRRTTQECVTHWDEALRLAPEYLPPRVSLARNALESGRPKEARRIIDECLAIDPACAEVQLLAGQLCWRAGDWTAARHHAEWLLANTGSHGMALTLLNQTRLPGGTLVRPAQRLAHHLGGRSMWTYLAWLLEACAILSILQILGVRLPRSALDADRMPLMALFATPAIVVSVMRIWPRWQAAQSLKAPDLSQDF